MNTTTMRERFNEKFLSTGTTWTGDTIVELSYDLMKLEN